MCPVHVFRHRRERFQRSGRKIRCVRQHDPYGIVIRLYARTSIPCCSEQHGAGQIHPPVHSREEEYVSTSVSPLGDVMRYLWHNDPGCSWRLSGPPTRGPTSGKISVRPIIFNNRDFARLWNLAALLTFVQSLFSITWTVDRGKNQFTYRFLSVALLRRKVCNGR